MKGFFDKIGKDVQKAINKNNNQSNNRGGGQALGGSKPGKLLSDIYIVDQGPIGIKLENTSQNHAIVASVSPGSIAESVGLQRGDIICHPDCNGMKEMLYNEFLAKAKSSERPIRIDVRRLAIPAKTAAAAAASSNKNTNMRADAESRRLAVIAAAEERNSKHKAKTRPIPKKKGGKIIDELTPEQLQKIELQKEENMKRNAIHMANKPLSDEAKKAIQAAKFDEAKHAAELGYNPYEVRKVTAGQASTASVAMAHGAINAGSGSGGTTGSSSPSIPSVQPPTNAMIPLSETTSTTKPQYKPINSVFDEAFKELTNSNNSDSNNEKISKSLRILRKLIANATSASSPNDPKRNVRMSEPNNLIKSCVIEMNGAVELLMSVGFIMSEIDGKTFLVYSDEDDDGDGNGGGTASWLSDALVKMEEYETYLAKNMRNETI